jgi:hypothetical protein
MAVLTWSYERPFAVVLRAAASAANGQVWTLTSTRAFTVIDAHAQNAENTAATTIINNSTGPTPIVTLAAFANGAVNEVARTSLYDAASAAIAVAESITIEVGAAASTPMVVVTCVPTTTVTTTATSTAA